MAFAKLTLTNSDDSTTVTNWTKLETSGNPEGSYEDAALGDQAWRVFCALNAASASGTLGFAVVRDGEVIYYDTATLTGGSNRTGTDQSSGNYLATVVWGVSGTDKVDLMGFEKDDTIYVGLPANLTTATSADFWIGTTRVI